MKEQERMIEAVVVVGWMLAYVAVGVAVDAWRDRREREHG